MSIDRKVTTRTGAAGVLVGAAITLGLVAFVTRDDGPAPAEKRTSVEVTTSTTAAATDATTSPATPATDAPIVVATTARTSDQRIAALEDRVHQLEDTTTTTVAPTTTTEEPTTTAPS